MKTSEFIVRRILLLIPVMIGVTVFTFAIAQIIPADPAAILCGERCGLIDPVTGKTMLELQRERLGLDEPVIEQFRLYLINWFEIATEVEGKSHSDLSSVETTPG